MGPQTSEVINKGDLIAYAYNKVDQDGNGRVDISELRAFLQELNGNEEVTAEEAQFVFKYGDADGDGSLDVAELEVTPPVAATRAWAFTSTLVSLFGSRP